MTTLAFEFSSSQRSVALARDANVVAAVSEIGERGTNAFGMIEQVLAVAKMGREEIECLAIGLGPGSYTGIRMALAIAQGWQLASGIKLLGISSAECLADMAHAERIFGNVNVVIDAQRGEFYLASYDIAAKAMDEIRPLKIVPATEVEALGSAGEVLLGPEVTRWFSSGKAVFPHASALARLAAGRNDFKLGADLEPVYLRTSGFVKLSAQR